MQCTVPSNPINATVSRTGAPVAGSEFTLGCIIQAVPGFSNMPTAVWRDADGAVITTSGDITIQTTPGSETTVTTLTFNPLKASDDGEYECMGTLTTPAQPDALTVATREVLQVQSKCLHISIAFATVSFQCSHPCCGDTPPSWHSLGGWGEHRSAVFCWR